MIDYTSLTEALLQVSKHGPQPAEVAAVGDDAARVVPVGDQLADADDLPGADLHDGGGRRHPGRRVHLDAGLLPDAAGHERHR